MLVLLAAVAVLSASSLTLVTRWSDQVRREQEQALLEVGDEYAGAIASYYRASTDAERRYPLALDDLLYDRRAFGLVRHLRRLSPDPITKSDRWGIVRAADGGIMGVYSLSNAEPMRQVPVTLSHAVLPAARSYSDWKFIPQVP